MTVEDHENRLIALLAKIDARAQEISSSRQDWPCRKGCDHCCRDLGAPLPITEPEYRLLRRGFDALSDEARERVLKGLREWERASRPFACPLLDPATGGCSVYAFRPAACRAYGFYVARDAGQWCHLIVEFLRQGSGRVTSDSVTETSSRVEADGIVWGNEAALLEDLGALGGVERPVSEWFRRDGLL